MITKQIKRALRKQCKTYGNGDWLVGRLHLLNKLNASVMEVMRFESDYYAWADGAQYYSLHKPSELV